MEPLLLATFIAYFVVVLGIGAYFYNRSAKMKEYFIADRQLNPYVVALSAQASDMSGWLLMGLPGSILVAGVGEIWVGIGLAIGTYLAWLIIAKRLRIYSEKANNSITISEYFSNRFGDEKGTIRVLCGIVLLIFFTFYVASAFVSGGKILQAIFPDSGYTAMMLACAAIIIVYTFLGGFKAVCWTDFFQAMLMVIAVVVVPLAALGHLGGWENVSGALDNVFDGKFLDLMYDGGKQMSALAIISLLAWGFGYFGMPHIVVRYMAISNPEEVKVARRVSLVWIVIALVAVCFVGIIGRAYLISQGYVFDGGNITAPGGGAYDPEHIFITMTGDLFFPLIAGFLFAAVMAAIMSTADSQLLVAASSITNDLIGQRYNLDDNRLMWISRIVVILVAIFALILAMFGGDNIMGLVSYAWAGFGAAFGPLMILALYWKRMNKYGAIATMIVGFATVVLWNTFLGDTGIYELLPGFVFALIAGVVVALVTPAPSQDIVQEFDDAQVYTEE